MASSLLDLSKTTYKAGKLETLNWKCLKIKLDQTKNVKEDLLNK